MKFIKFLLVVLLTTQVFAMGKVLPEKNNKQGSVVEIVTFKLNEGVTVDEFLPLDKEVELQYVSKQSGFISRETAANDNGEWLVIVHWSSVEDAEASMASFAEAHATQEFLTKLDMSTMSMKRYFSN